MSYQATTAPRFFIDYLQLHRHLGRQPLDGTHYDTLWNMTGQSAGTHKLCSGLIGLNPAYDIRHIGLSNPSHTGYNVCHYLGKFPVHEMNCAGLLGHNLKTAGATQVGMYYSAIGSDGATLWPAANCTNDIKINCTGTGSHGLTPNYDGFSISLCNDTTGVNNDTV